MTSTTLGRELRTGSDPLLQRRRGVITLKLLEAMSLGVVARYQTGMISHLPDLPFAIFDSDSVDASPDAYKLLAVQDAALGITNACLTHTLAAIGGQDRYRTKPWLPLLLAGKIGFDTSQAARLFVNQLTKQHVLCFYCTVAAFASFASVPLARAGTRGTPLSAGAGHSHVVAAKACGLRPAGMAGRLGGHMQQERLTPVGAVAAGLVAGAIGTAAMDLVWYWRYKRGGGESGLFDWEKASAPAKLGKRLYQGFRQQEQSARYAALTNNLMHWGYGIMWGGVYGTLVGSLRSWRVLFGLPFGAAVWTSNYVRRNALSSSASTSCTMSGPSVRMCPVGRSIVWSLT